MYHSSQNPKKLPCKKSQHLLKKNAAVSKNFSFKTKKKRKSDRKKSRGKMRIARIVVKGDIMQRMKMIMKLIYRSNLNLVM